MLRDPCRRTRTHLANGCGSSPSRACVAPPPAPPPLPSPPSSLLLAAARARAAAAGCTHHRRCGTIDAHRSSQAAAAGRPAPPRACWVEPSCAPVRRTVPGCRPLRAAAAARCRADAPVGGRCTRNRRVARAGRRSPAARWLGACGARTAALAAGRSSKSSFCVLAPTSHAASWPPASHQKHTSLKTGLSHQRSGLA